MSYIYGYRADEKLQRKVLSGMKLPKAFIDERLEVERKTRRRARKVGHGL